MRKGFSKDGTLVLMDIRMLAVGPGWDCIGVIHAPHSQGHVSLLTMMVGKSTGDGKNTYSQPMGTTSLVSIQDPAELRFANPPFCWFFPLSFEWGKG